MSHVAEATRPKVADSISSVLNLRFDRISKETPLISALKAAAYSQLFKLSSTVPEALQPPALPTQPHPPATHLTLPLEKMLNRKHSLRSLPRLLNIIKRKLYTAEGDTSSAVCEVATLISYDPCLTTAVLHAANSRFFSNGRTSCGVQAAQALGYDELVSLVLSASLAPSRQDDSKLETELEFLWKHSVCVGVLAERIAEELALPNPREYYTAGLLHDIGRLYMMAVYPHRTRQTLYESHTYNKMQLTEEQQMFGYDHAVLGAELLRIKRVEDAIVDAVRLHHTHGECVTSSIPCVVHIADITAKSIGYHPLGDFCVMPENPHMWKELNMTEHDLLPIIDHAVNTVEAISENLSEYR